MKELFVRLFSASSFLPKEGAKGEMISSKEAYGNLMRIALPSIAEMVLMSIIGSIDTMMVSTIGTEAIAAVGLVGQPRMLMLCIFFAMNVGITAIVARRKGENRKEDANTAMRNSILLIIVMSAVMTLLGLAFSRPLLKLAGAASDTINDANAYFRIITAVLPINAVTMAICAAQRGVGNTKITMYVNITSNLVNVLFNWLLINGVGPFPKLGVAGAAIATDIGLFMGFVLSVISLFSGKKHDSFLELKKHDNWRINRSALMSVVKVGGNAMIEQIALRIGFFLYARIVADLGTQAFASHQICMQFLNLSFNFGDGLGVAGTSLVGQMLGKKRSDLAHVYGKCAQRIAFLIAVTLATCIVIFRYPLVGLFSDEPVVVELSAKVMLFVAVFQPFQTSAVVVGGALRGAGDTRYVAKIMAICVTVIRPVLSFAAVYVIRHYFTPILSTVDLANTVQSIEHWTTIAPPQWALLGAWGASLVDMSIRMTLMIKRFNGGQWHEIKV